MISWGAIICMFANITLSFIIFSNFIKKAFNLPLLLIKYFYGIFYRCFVRCSDSPIMII